MSLLGLIITIVSAVIAVAVLIYQFVWYRRIRPARMKMLHEEAQKEAEVIKQKKLLEVKEQIRPFGVDGGANASHPFCELYLGQAVTDGPLVWSYNASKTDYSSQAYNLHDQDAIQDAKDCAADLERHTIVLDLNSSPKKFEVWTDGVKKASKDLANVSDGTQTYPLGLFAKCRHVSGMYSSVQATYNNPAKMRLYSFRIYESGTLVKEFLPWVKGGVAGLKETKSGRFHTGENARACVAGGDVTIEKDDPYVSMPDNTIASAAVKGKSLYFNTGYTFKPTSRLELDYALLTPDWTASTSRRIGTLLEMHGW